MSKINDYKKDWSNNYFVKYADYSDEMQNAVRVIAFYGHVMELKSSYNLPEAINEIEASIAFIKDEYSEAFEGYDDSPLRKDTDYYEKTAK